MWRYRRLLFLVAVVGATALSGALFFLARLPLPPAAAPVQTTFVTDASGQLLATFDTAGQNRVSVPLSRVPKVLVQAVVATEDRNFWREGPISPTGILRATWADLRGHSLEGGSTITQQYVKNTYVGDQRTLGRKLREAVLAIKVAHTLSKAQILQRYLNTIYFGRGAYGVEAASEAYFGTDVRHLGLGQAAYLAGLIRSPETADASRDPVAARQRRDLTLSAMERSGELTPAQVAAAEAVPMAGPRGLVRPPVSLDARIQARNGAQYFVSYVREQLIRRYGEAEVDGGGLRVRTSLDLTTQDQAYQAVYGFLGQGEPAGALVALDSTGAVKAMVGGRDFATSKVNLAVGRDGGGSGRQAGSTFKAFLLAAAVKQGWSVESAFPAPPQIDLPQPGGKTYQVSNFESESSLSPINLVSATKDSVNTVYAQLEAKLGAGRLVAMAHALGITSPLQPDPSLVLGTADVSVLEMAGAYSTFANDGVRVTPRAILQVTTADGRILQPDQVQRTRVLTPAQAAIVDYALSQVVQYGTGQAAAIGRPLAGKTGTTEHYDDAWFVGYTPQLTAAVWMGYPDSESRAMTDVRGMKVTGGSFPAQLFERFMSMATAHLPVDGFPDPPSLYGPSLTGLLVPYVPGYGLSGGSSSSSSSGSFSEPSTSSPTTTVPGQGSSTTTGKGSSMTTSVGSTTTLAPPKATATTSPATTSPQTTTTTTGGSRATSPATTSPATTSPATTSPATTSARATTTTAAPPTTSPPTTTRPSSSTTSGGAPATTAPSHHHP